MPTGIAKLSVSPNNGYPGFCAGDKYFPPSYFEEGNRKIVFEYDYGKDIIFKLKNKQQEDTTIDANGEITKDKYIMLEHMLLEYVELRETHFHQFFFDPFFGVNEEEKILHIPTPDEFPKWTLKLQVT